MKLQGFQEDQFDFVKRRGRIHVIHRHSGRQFSYLRKKYTRLRPDDHSWESGESFKVKVNETPEFEVENWSGTMQRFRDWLSRL